MKRALTEREIQEGLTEAIIRRSMGCDRSVLVIDVENERGLALVGPNSLLVSQLTPLPGFVIDCYLN
jgi:hypothetical protein